MAAVVILELSFNETLWHRMKEVHGLELVQKQWMSCKNRQVLEWKGVSTDPTN